MRQEKKTQLKLKSKNHELPGKGTNMIHCFNPLVLRNKIYGEN